MQGIYQSSDSNSQARLDEYLQVQNHLSENCNYRVVNVEKSKTWFYNNSGTNSEEFGIIFFITDKQQLLENQLLGFATNFE